MVRFDRTEHPSAPINWSGHVVTPVAETVSVGVDAGPIRLRWQLQRPVLIEVEGASAIPITDHVLAARLVAFVLRALAPSTRRLGP